MTKFILQSLAITEPRENILDARFMGFDLFFFLCRHPTFDRQLCGEETDARLNRVFYAMF